MGSLVRHASQDLRTLVSTLGVGYQRGNLIIPYLWMAPTTTDLDSAHTIEIVKLIQTHLRELGGQVEVTGRVDLPTAELLKKVVGPAWMSSPWAQTLKALVGAHERGTTIAPMPAAQGQPVALKKKGLGDLSLPSLPDLPGGMLTYAGLAGAAYYFLVHKKKRRA